MTKKYNNDEEGSPIKRMKDFPEQKATRFRENSVGNTDVPSYWRDRETKLSEMTSNRLNEARSSRYNDLQRVPSSYSLSKKT